MISTRAATASDVRDVMANLSDISGAEVFAAGYTLHSGTQLMVQTRKRHGATAIVEGDQAIAILIFDRSNQTEWSTLFMAKEPFFRSGRSEPTKALRRHIDGVLRSNPGVALSSITYSTHPELARWYRIMGYGEGKPEGRGTRFRRTAHDLRP
jgi:hypothetical protein